MEAIADVRHGTAWETETHALYLFRSPVCDLACDVRRGRLGLWKGVVTSIRGLGSILTIWEDLGTLSASKEYQQQTLTVAQVLPTFSRADCGGDSQRHREQIETFMHMRRNGVLTVKITILVGADGSVMIVDGCHTAGAVYEVAAARGSGDRTAVPVYLLAPS
jgi:hypothetical protein